MAKLFQVYLNKESKILDVCCGFGILSQKLMDNGFENITAFDVSYNLTEIFKGICAERYSEISINIECENYERFFQNLDFKKDKGYNIISNPPYEMEHMIPFFQNLYNVMEEDNIAVILIPKGFINKERPKQLKDITSKFKILHSEDMKVKFERTGVNAEILVLTI